MIRKIERGEATIAVDDEGEGTPTFYVHGFGLSRRAMIPLAGHLSEGRRSILLDWRGHGDTRCPPKDDAYSFEILRDDLRYAIDEVAQGPVDLIGHSMGGQVALSLALESPQCFRSLVLLGAGPLRKVTDERELEAWNRSATYFEQKDAESVERMLWSSTSLADPDTMKSELSWIYAGARGPDLARMIRGAFLHVEENLEECSELDIPTLLVAGELDRTWLKPSRTLHHVIQGSRLRVVPQAGHLVHLEAEDEVVEAIRDFWSTPSG